MEVLRHTGWEDERLMAAGEEILRKMEHVAAVFCRHQVIEAVFHSNSFRFEARLYPPDVFMDRDGRRAQVSGCPTSAGKAGARASRPMAEASSCVLLRSPAVGVWEPTVTEEEGKTGRSAIAGTVHTLLGEEKVTAPREGKPLKGIAEKASLVGFGDPLVLWEVARGEKGIQPTGMETDATAQADRA